MSKYNLLQNINTSNSTLILNPCPIIIIKNALTSNSVYQELVEEYPSISKCFYEDSKNHKVMISNTTYEIPSNTFINSEDYSTKWKKFIEFHTSNNFLKELLNLQNLKKLEGLTNIKSNIKMDCLVGYNSPVIQKSCNPDKYKYYRKGVNIIYCGFFFLRKDIDDSKGGSIEFYHDDGTTKKKIISIPYQKNCFIMFIGNGDRISCQESYIEPTLHCRKMVKIVGYT
jgi:hypothetical protein